MYSKYYFHIQFTKDSEWITEIGFCITHIMASRGHWDDMPYAYIKGDKF
jgi:hypothetical protein